MRPLCLLFAFLSVAACKSYDPLFCDDEHPCEDPSRPYCDREGIHPGSEGLGNTCVPDPFDAGPSGVDLDASVGDAATSDGLSGDDAAPTTPPVTTGQAADRVLGQPDFLSKEGNQGGLSARSLYFPMGLATDGQRLIAADAFNGRVIVWNGLPGVNHPAADVAVGQANLWTRSNSVSAAILAGVFGPYEPLSARVGGGKLAVADPQANRVLVWNSIPTSSGQPADLVLGQSSFGEVDARPRGAGSLHKPGGVWTDGTRLAIADRDSRRVLIWNSWPSTNGQPADLVLGQMGFSASAAGSPPTASSMTEPWDVLFDGQRLYVVDAADNRVMVWNGWPSSNNQPADFFLGQFSDSSAHANAGGTGPNEYGFSFPTSIAVSADAVFVTDRMNRRVMVYFPIPDSTGAAAAVVLGQGTFSSNTADVGAAGLSDTCGAVAAGDKLFVSDCGNHRILRYSLSR